MASSPLVVVYDPAGNPFKHTRANARDLVNGSGWSWKSGVRTLPVEGAPFAAAKPPTALEPAQAVINNAGHNAERTVVSAMVDEDDVVDMSADATITDDIPVVQPGVEAPADSVQVASESLAEAPAAETPAADEAVETPAEEGPADEAPKARRGRRAAAD